ncbi:Uncharacterised protein [Starkeya nomas]|uniref:Uncharacterized protein n=2 Tax=Xanthobacteraceae TaxID=335928 RepID=A0A5S9P9M3_9HYPH|nr:Uncharacterised protein [Starkeya nomas]
MSRETPVILAGADDLPVSGFSDRRAHSRPRAVLAPLL